MFVTFLREGKYSRYFILVRETANFEQKQE